MGFIQLGKAPDKLLNKSSKGYKGLLAKQAPPSSGDLRMLQQQK